MKKEKVNESLMAEIKADYRAQWPKSDEMYDWCIKQVNGAVKLSSGHIVVFRKRDIETHFCYGFGQNGVTTEREMREAAESAENIKHKEAFIRANLEGFPDYAEESEYYELKEANGSRIVGIVDGRHCQYAGGHFRRLTAEDIRLVRAEAEVQKQGFVKRLETYWKRYGASKLRTWTYLVD